jgi:hypothetical protein
MFAGCESFRSRVKTVTINALLLGAGIMNALSSHEDPAMWAGRPFGRFVRQLRRVHTLGALPGVPVRHAWPRAPLSRNDTRNLPHLTSN